MQDYQSNLIQIPEYDISYDPVTGFFFQDGKRIFVNEGFVHFKNKGKRVKLKAIRLAWMIFNKSRIPEGYTILAKDFDINNIKINNILILRCDIARKIKEAHRNIYKYLKLRAHPTDKYKYVLMWRENGKIIREVHHGPESAKQRLKKLQLKYAKLITKYMVTQ